MSMVSPNRNPAARHALSAAGRVMLSDWLRDRPLLAFDFDGTLAPIVSDPAAAALPSRTIPLLSQLAARLPCIVVSGRARADVSARMSGLPLAEVVGNHGSEPFIDLEPLRAQVARWKPVVQERLGHLAGILIEDKGCSLSIHYRNAPSRHEVLTTTLDAIAQLGIERVIHGKCVLNLLPTGALHKGMGLGRAMARLKKTHALYVGDDDTDEDVFRLPAAAGVLGIRVDYRSSSMAPLYLYGQAEMDALLSFLVSLLELE
jgi:trehalose 6-phosphate phosphatase